MEGSNLPVPTYQGPEDSESSDDEQDVEYLDEDDSFDDDVWASHLTRRATMLLPADVVKLFGKSMIIPRSRTSTSQRSSVSATKARHSLAIPSPTGSPVATHSQPQNVTNTSSPLKTSSSSKPPIPRLPSSAVLSPRGTPPLSPQVGSTTSPRVPPAASPRSSTAVPATSPRTSVAPTASPRNITPILLSPRARSSTTPVSPQTTTTTTTTPTRTSTQVSPRTPGNEEPLRAASTRASVVFSPATMEFIPPGTPLSPRVSNPPVRTSTQISPRATSQGSPLVVDSSEQKSPRPALEKNSPMYISDSVLHSLPRTTSAPNTPDSLAGIPGRMRSLSSPAVSPPPPPPRSQESRARQQEIVQHNRAVDEKKALEAATAAAATASLAPVPTSTVAPVAASPAPAAAMAASSAVVSPATTTATAAVASPASAMAASPAVVSPATSTAAAKPLPAVPLASLSEPAKPGAVKKPLPAPPVPPKKSPRAVSTPAEMEKAASIIQRCYKMWQARRTYRKMVAAFKYRSHIAAEILSTERTYVSTLRIIVSKYYEPIVKNCSSFGIENEDVKVIFGGLEVLLNVNTSLLDSLEKRMISWSPTTCLGDLFLVMGAFLKTYTEYVKNFDLSLRKLADCTKNQKFENFLKSAEENDGIRTPIESLLITPVQRIPRYVLLLQQLHEHTPTTHPDHEQLGKAIVQIKDVATYINEKKRESDNALRVVQIQSLLTGKAPNIIAAQRRFCHEGELSILSKSGKKKKKRYWFVFNDILLCTKPLNIQTIFSNKRKYKYQLFIALHRADLIEIEETGETGFVIATNTHFYNLYADTPEQKAVWVDVIQKSLNTLRSSEKFYEERASKLAQEKANATKAFLASQYAALRVQDAFHSFPVAEKKPAGPATTGTYTVSKPPPAYKREKAEEEPPSPDEQAFTDFLAKGGQKAQFADLLKRLVGKSSVTNSPEATAASLRSSAPLKIQTSSSATNTSTPTLVAPGTPTSEPRTSLSMVRRNSNATQPPNLASSSESVASTSSSSSTSTSIRTRDRSSTQEKITTQDTEDARRIRKAKSIADVATLKQQMLRELTTKCKQRTLPAMRV